TPCSTCSINVFITFWWGSIALNTERYSMTSRFPAGTVAMVMSPVVEAPSANPPTTWARKGCLATLSTSRTSTGLAVVFATLTLGVLTTLTFVGDGGDGVACVADGSAKQPRTS